MTADARPAGVPDPAHSPAVDGAALPAALADIRDDFLAVSERDRLLMLLEFSDALPELPERLAALGDDGLERVAECQSPVFIHLEVDDGHVAMFATAPAEAPTTRGFASILVDGITGLTVDETLAIPADFPDTLGLREAVSPLRLRGMTALLARAKRQVAALAGAASAEAADPRASDSGVPGAGVPGAGAAGGGAEVDANRETVDDGRS